MTLTWVRRIVGRIADVSGAVATEYALLLVLMALAIIAALTGLGLAIAGMFSDGAGAFPG